MCGIFGASRLTPMGKEMMKFLAWDMEERGDDSWGGSDGAEVVKCLGGITEGFVVEEGWERGVWHTRAASVGAVTLENAHPFVVEKGSGRVMGEGERWERGKAIIGVHNGCIGGWERLKKEGGFKGEVDSQVLYSWMASGRDLGEVYGWGALVWWDGGRMFLGRFNMEDLAVGRLMGEGEGVVVCSRKKSIEKAARMCGGGVEYFYKIEQGKRYVVGMGEDGRDELQEDGEMKFGGRVVVGGGGRYSFGGVRDSYHGRSRGEILESSYYGYGREGLDEDWARLAREGEDRGDQEALHQKGLRDRESSRLCAKCTTVALGKVKRELFCPACLREYTERAEKMILGGKRVWTGMKRYWAPPAVMG